MKRILNKLLDVLFPPRATQLLVRHSETRMNSHEPGYYEGIFFCTQYTRSVVRAAVLENKFHNNPQAQKILAAILIEWTDTKQLTDACFVSIPLGKARLHSRGHNQVVSILKETELLYDNSLLTRTKETAPQASLNRQKRLFNSKNIFACDTELASRLKYKTIILLDDVVTTGATLNEARATLAPHLPPDTKLICLAIAH